MKKTLFAAIAIVAMTGCAKEEGTSPEIESSDVVSFTSEISSRVSADGTMWGVNDKVGIMMVNVAADLSETIATDSYNIQYQSDNDDAAAASVAFEFVEGDGAVPLLYPNSGSVKFYAYYPYQESMVADTYLFAADVSNQATTDLMIAKTEVTDRYTDSEVLTFTHMLSLLTLSITPNENVPDLKDLAISIKGLNTEGSYNIQTGALSGSLSDDTTAIDFTTVETTTGDVVTKVVATAIVLPETLAKVAELTFTLDSRSFSTSLPATTTEFVSTKNHTYNVAVGNDYAEFKSGATITGWGDGTVGDMYSTEN